MSIPSVRDFRDMVRALMQWSPAALLVLALTSLAGCAASLHDTTTSELGSPASSDAMIQVLSEPGPVRFERVIAADWAVDRGGLINLGHPRAEAAGIEPGDEPIQIYFYVIEHPEFGTYIIDSGIEQALRTPEESERIGPLIRAAMKTDLLKVRTTTAEWLAEHRRPLSGVFLTHLHLDHVMGIPDLPARTPVFTGPGETAETGALNLFTRGTNDRFLASTGPLREWQFEADPSERFAGVIDVFGDASVFALHVPGHTAGSTAFVVRTAQGTKLIVGDACHTRWGWENDVEPGQFSADQPGSAISLARLRRFSAEHPELEVFLGHQSLEDRAAIAATPAAGRDRDAAPLLVEATAEGLASRLPASSTAASWEGARTSQSRTYSPPNAR